MRTAAEALPAKKKRPLLLRLAQQWQLQLLALLGLGFVILFCYIPICWNVIAFQDFKIVKGIGGSPWVGLKHFRAFLSDPTFWRIPWACPPPSLPSTPWGRFSSPCC